MDSPRLSAKSSRVSTEEITKRERIPPYVRSGVYPPRPYQLSPYYYRNIFVWFIPFLVLTIMIASISRMSGFSFYSESSTLGHGLQDTKQMSTIPISDFVDNHLPSMGRFPHLHGRSASDIDEKHIGWFDWAKSLFFSRPSEAEILHAKETFEKVNSEAVEPESKFKVEEEINKAKSAFEKIEKTFQPYTSVVHTAEQSDTTEIRRENDGIHIIHTYVREIILSADQFEKESDAYKNLKEKIEEETEKVKQKATELGSEVKEKVEQASDSIKDVKERVEDFGEVVKEKLKETGEEIKDSLKEKISEGAEIVKEKAEEVGEKIKEKVIEEGEKIKEKIVEGRDIVRGKVEEGSELLKEKWIEGSEIVREKVERVGEKIKEKVIEEGEKVYNQAEDLKGKLKDKVLEVRDNTKEDLWYVSEAVKQRAKVLFADWDKIEQWKAEEARLKNSPYINLPPSSTQRPSNRPLPTVQQTPDFAFSNSQPLSRDQIEYYQKIMGIHLPEHEQAHKDLLSEKLHGGYQCAKGLCQDAKNKVEDFTEGVKMRVEDRWEHVKDAGKVLSNEAKDEFEKVERVKENIEEKLREEYERAKSAGKELKNKAEDFGEGVKMRVEDRWEHVKDAGKELKEKIEESNESLKGKICDGFCGESKFHDSKDDTGHEFEDSLKNTWNDIKEVLDKAKDVSKRGYERAMDRSHRDQQGNKIY